MSTRHKNILKILTGLSIILFGNITNSIENIRNKDIGHLSITIYRSPTCDCCKDWITHLKNNNFQITDIPTANMDAIKQKYDIPPNMESCHTAFIDGYLIEGHVPANDIKLLLKTKLKITGIAVPGMPVGPPGMESGKRKDPFKVLSFDKKGKITLFKEYIDY